MSIGTIDGDPDGLRTSVSDMRETTEALGRAVRALQHIASQDGYRSLAVDAAASDIEDVIETVTNVRTRYCAATEALEKYEPVLRSAQQRAEHARAEASSVDVHGATMDVARAASDAAMADAMGILDPGSAEARAQAHADLSAAKAALHRARAVMDAAESEFSSALATVEHAALIAAGDIDAGNRESHLNDSIWDDLKGFYDKYLAGIMATLVEVLKWVSTILSVISIVVAFIPGLQGFAALLKIASIVVSMASLILVTIQAMLGAATWGDVLVAGIGVALSVVAIKFNPGAVGKGLAAFKVDTIDAVAKKAGTSVAERGVAGVLATREGHEFLAKGAFGVMGLGGKILGNLDSFNAVEFVADPGGYAAEHPGGVIGEYLKGAAAVGSAVGGDGSELINLGAEMLGDGYNAAMGDSPYTSHDIDTSINPNASVDTDAIFEKHFGTPADPVLSCSTGSSRGYSGSGGGGGGGGGW